MQIWMTKWKCNSCKKPFALPKGERPLLNQCPWCKSVNITQGADYISPTP